MRDANRLHHRLEALREKFAAVLPDRLAAMRAQCEAALRGPLEDPVLQELGLVAHTLKGSAATYGYMGLCDRVVRLEETLASLIARPLAERARFTSPVAAALALLGDIGTARDLDAQTSSLDEAIRKPLPKSPAERSLYLLEDDPSLRDLLSTQLGHYGYRVVAFDAAVAFTEAVGHQAPDVLVLDIALSGTDLTGLDVLSKLRQTKRDLPPVIVTTSRTDLDARVGAVRAGASAYFTKPVDVTDLVATLDRLTWIEPVEPYRILIVDDDAATAGYHGEFLKAAKMEAHIVDTPEAVMEQLTEFRPDLLLLDLYMPRISGADLAAVIRQQSSFASVPIVFLSSEQDPDKHLATIIGGADDFLTKPIHPDRLISSITARAQRARLLRSMTIQDPMTKLLNHSACKDHLAAELARARRYGTSMVFALMDIDHFKHVNDTYGHPVGDAVIWGLARLLRQRLRQSDVICRYGGEEFAVIMPETSLDQAVGVLDNLRARFGELEFTAGEARFTMTFSGGVTLTKPTDQCADVIRTADEALYAAKRGGRNRICSGDALDAPAEASLQTIDRRG